MRRWSWAWLGRGRLAPALALVTAAVVSTIIALHAFAEASSDTYDDALIVLVYAKHLAATGRIFWNANELPVDGYTSFLDLVVKACALCISPNDPIRVAWWVTVGYLGLASACAFRLGTRMGSVLSGAIAAMTIATSTATYDAASFLLEGPLFVAAVLFAVHETTWGERPWRWCVAWSALVLVRPEGGALALAMIAGLSFRLRSVTRLARPVLAFALVWVVYLLWHRIHFGAFAPNTYYAKRSDSSLNELHDGLAYVRAFLASPSRVLTIASALLVPLLAAARSLWSDGAARTRFASIALLAPLSLAITIVSGGDSYGGARFMAVPVVLAFAALAVAADGLRGWRRLVAIVPMVGALLEHTSDALVYPAHSRRVMQGWPLTEKSFACDIAVVSSLKRLEPEAIAESDYQRLKLWADDLRVVDLSGLSDRQIAHRPEPGPVRFGKASWDDVLRDHAGVVIMGSRYIGAPLAAHSTREVLATPALMAAHFGIEAPSALVDPISAAYTTASLRTCGGSFNFLVRRDLAARATGNGVRVGPENDAAQSK